MGNCRKRMNLKMQGILDTFVVDMNETIQKLSDLTEPKSGNDSDKPSFTERGEVPNSDHTNTKTGNTDAYDNYCSVVGSPEPVTADDAEVVMAKEVGKAESVSVSTPSGKGNDDTVVLSADNISTGDVAMASKATWEVVHR